MTLEKISPTNAGFYAPRFEVQIDNMRLAVNMSKAIIDITVEEKIDEGVSFRMTVHDEFDLTTQQFKWLDHPLFDIGNNITIKFGYGSTLFTLVVGSITSIEPSFFSGETPTLTVAGQDLSYDYLKRSSPERTFVSKSYSDIAGMIASDAGLLPVVDNTGEVLASVCKKGDQSYYSFLEKLAREVGYQFNMDGQTMYFVKPTDSRQEILTLELGKDLLSFRPSMKSSGLVTEVEVRGHNPNDPGKPTIGRAGAGSERAQEAGRKTGSQIMQDKNRTVKRVITDLVVNSQAHANAIALAELNKASDSLIEGEVECIGLPQIRTGVTVRLEKVGRRFSGKYYVKATSHSIGESGYRTRFSVKRNAL